MMLGELIAGMDVRCLAEGADLSAIRICDVTEDSRTAVPGSLFIARAGTTSDGNKYIEPAIQCGCVAILSDRADVELPPRAKVVVLVADDVKESAAKIAERFYGNPGKSLMIAGVTGTNGKTTIAHLAHQLIEAGGIRCGLIGTVEIDDGRERARAAMTTPPAVELSRTLATMVEHRCKAVMMEVSSHALDQARCGAIRFDACAFTNLTGDHLDYHQSLEHYRASKAKLFRLLKPDGLAAINVDDESSGAMIEQCTKGAQIVSCSPSEFVEIANESITGMTLTIKTPIGELESRVGFFGAFNAMNVLQAALLAHAVMSKAGHTPAEQIEILIEALPTLSLPAGRFEHVEGAGDAITVLVDFAHTDDALASALSAIRAVLNGEAKLWCVFGCGGDRDTTKRPRMGKVVAELADEIVVTSDNPRTEVPSRIIDEILSGMEHDRRKQAHVHPDRAQAIAFAVAKAAVGDVVLIAGKGHETEQISPDAMGGVRTVHFDDREHARIALRERRMRFPVAEEHG
jgi:UDP-N-acetylmuramoyl-L-alanyl-D-glutamate--2,6-diaminopimelate ligase